MFHLKIKKNRKVIFGPEQKRYKTLTRIFIDTDLAINLIFYIYYSQSSLINCYASHELIHFVTYSLPNLFIQQWELEVRVRIEHRGGYSSKKKKRPRVRITRTRQIIRTNDPQQKLFQISLAVCIFIPFPASALQCKAPDLCLVSVF